MPVLAHVGIAAKLWIDPFQRQSMLAAWFSAKDRHALARVFHRVFAKLWVWHVPVVKLGLQRVSNSCRSRHLLAKNKLRVVFHDDRLHVAGRAGGVNTSFSLSISASPRLKLRYTASGIMATSSVFSMATGDPHSACMHSRFPALKCCCQQMTQNACQQPRFRTNGRFSSWHTGHSPTHHDDCDVRCVFVRFNFARRIQ